MGSPIREAREVSAGQPRGQPEVRVRHVVGVRLFCIVPIAKQQVFHVCKAATMFLRAG